MYDREKLTQKVNRLYEKGELFRAYIEDRPVFPYAITLKNISQSQIQKEYLRFTKAIEKLQVSFPLEYKEVVFKTMGRQKMPSKIVFASKEAYLEFIDKKHEYEHFVERYETITRRYPALKAFFVKKPFTVLEYQGVWEKLLLVMAFLQRNNDPQIYIRELPMRGVDTKFIEQYKKIIDTLLSVIQNREPLTRLSQNAFEKRYGFLYPEPLIRFRILDPALSIQGLNDLSVTQRAFQSLQILCKKIFIVENEITTLSFPECEDAIVIFGRGYGVKVLKEVTWFMDKKIYYWGDIDMDGYAILSQIRGYYPHVQSILMDEPTFETYRDLCVELKAKNSIAALPNLSPDEQRVYEKLYSNATQIRLEQERIPLEALEKLSIFRGAHKC